MITHNYNKYNVQFKLKKKLKKLHIIDENKVFIEKQYKYNNYNQINIIDKLYEFYVSIIKFLNII